MSTLQVAIAKQAKEQAEAAKKKAAKKKTTKKVDES